MNNLLYENLKIRYENNRLSPTWIISGESLENDLSNLKKFINLYLVDTSISLEKYPDFHYVEKSSTSKEISIDQIRELHKFLNKTAGVGKNRIAVIYEAELMNIYASNACLKILEDIAKNSYIFLLTKKPILLLKTIRSRCAFFNTPGLISFSEHSNDYQKFIEFLVSDKEDINYAIINELKNKNKELLNRLSHYSINLIIRLIKNLCETDVSLTSLELKFADRLINKHFTALTEKFENIIKLNYNTYKYDLDLVSSYILLVAQVKK